MMRDDNSRADAKAAYRVGAWAALFALVVLGFVGAQAPAPKAQPPSFSQGKKSITLNAKLSAEEKQLVGGAWKASELTYSPYSKFPVGACLLAENTAGERRIFSGANIENASYGLTVCAERTVAFKAASEGFRTFRALAIVCAKAPGGSPCGACRQVLREFGKDATVLVIADKDSNVVRWTVDELLPDSFGPDSLK